MAQYSVAVVGLGKIGLPLAAQFAHAGMRVIGCDISQEVVDTINAGHSHVKEEPGLEEMVAAGVADGNLSATTDTPGAVRKSNVVLVIVPVIVDEQRNIDYRYIDAATASVAAGLQRNTLVIYETTLPAGTTRTRFGPKLEQGSGLKMGRDFSLAFSPERVYSGRIFRDLRKYPKIVGGVTQQCTSRALAFYEVALEGAPVMPMQDADTAELVKLMETTYRDVNIALANQFARFAASRGLPVDQAIFAANTQPFSHIHRPGIAVGGHCIPVYPYFLINESGDETMGLLVEARTVNDDMAEWAVGRLGEALNGLEGKRVLLLGIAYRENVKETAFSGAVRIIDILKKQGAVPLLSDPLYTPEELLRYGGEPVTLEPLPACDAAILHAYHDAYKSLDWRKLAEKGCKVVLDGRNSLDREAIESARMRYIGIGR
ncbi:MAG TPA: nucleotide sugar dehydrogenase [Chloroflexia bacterium]